MTPAQRRVIVIGASAGGIDALRQIAAALPADFATPICVVIHTSPESPGLLHEILGRAGPLPAVSPRSGAALEPGRIYVAPPDHHMLLEPGRVRLTRGPRENRFRPAIDPLFRSAAQVYGPAAIGVILTGNLDDGIAGLWAVKQLGGTAVVQDPADALYPSMPLHAVKAVEVDFRVPLFEVPAVLVQLAAAPLVPPAAAGAVPNIDAEMRVAREEDPMTVGLERFGEVSRYACPDCHGVLMQMHEGGRLRFRCHTGHAYSVESLVAGVNEGIEEALSNAHRSLEEGARYLRHLSAHLEGAGELDAARRYGAQALETQAQADTLRALILGRQPLAASDPVP